MQGKLFVPLFAAVALTTALTAFAQQQPRFIPEDHRPPLFLKETWKEPMKGVTEAVPSAEYLTNPNVEMKLYGPGKGEVELVHHASPVDEPSYIWTGLVASGNWALMLRDKNNYVDLSGPVAKIRWRTKEAGFHMLRPVLKLADGTMLVGDYVETYSVDWRETEFPIANVIGAGWMRNSSSRRPTVKLKKTWISAR